MSSLVAVASLLYDGLGPLKQPPLRVLLALAWTLFATVLLVQSSSSPVVGPPAPPGDPELVREVQLIFGHITVFSVLVCLWWWALTAYIPETRVLFVAVAFALIFGAITEWAQTFSANRSASIFDLAVNWAVTLITAILILTRPPRTADLS